MVDGEGDMHNRMGNLLWHAIGRCWNGNSDMIRGGPCVTDTATSGGCG